MYRPTFCLVLAVASAGFSTNCLAQLPRSTSPRGYLSKAGDADIWHAPLTTAAQNFVQVDRTQVGKARTLRRIWFRRNQILPSAPDFNAFRWNKLLKVSIRVAHANWSEVGKSTKLSSLLRSGWQVVANGVVVNSLDWSRRGKGAVAPFDFSVPFSKSFNYDGRSALIWQVEFAAATPLAIASVPPLDGFSLNFRDSRGDAFGPLTCRPSGLSATGVRSWVRIRVYADGRPTDVNFATYPGLGNLLRQEPTWMAFGTRLLNFNLGLCVPLLVDPIMVFRTDRAGSGVLRQPLWGEYGRVQVPHQAGFVGFEIRTQGFGQRMGSNVFQGSQAYRSGAYPAPPRGSVDVASGAIARVGKVPFANSLALTKNQGLVVGLD